MTKVLITGATGGIGRRVSKALLDRGDAVVGLSRDPVAAAAGTDPAITWHAWDPTSGPPSAEAFAGVNAVINLHGEKIMQPWTAEAKQRIQESREVGTANLVAALRDLQTKPKVLVSGSADGYYGDRGSTTVDESDGPGEGFAPHAAAAWEAAARGAEDAGIRLVTVRSGPVLSTDLGILTQLIPQFRSGAGGPVGSGEQYTNWIHVDDEVALFLWAVDNDHVQGIVNGTAPDSVTNGEFAAALGEALGTPADGAVPAAVVLEQFGPELGAFLLGGAHALPKRTQELGFTFEHTEIREALRSVVGAAS